jgi:cell division septation protein DedD
MPDESGSGGVREFRLEGGKLALAGLGLLVLLAVAFFAGRWVERQRHPPPTAGPGAIEDPLTQLEPDAEPVDVEESLDHFDNLEGGEKELEPQREVGRRTEPSPAPPPPAGGEAGRYYVQVWAGRERAAAELLVGKLQKEGFPVRLFSDRVEGDTLFKVRVGGFESDGRAREIAAELEQQGYRGAWVTTVE